MYRQNMLRAFKSIQENIKQYPYIGIDTEFPGYFQEIQELQLAIGKSNLECKNKYDLFRHNIDNLKLIQFGIALCNEKGETPSPAAYQFNFKFDIDADQCSMQSRSFLRESFKSEDLDRFKYEGISKIDFSAQLLQSGLICNPDVHWFCFHGNQDFGYLVKQCCFDPLPAELQDFRNLLNTLFPNLTDLKTSLKWEFGLSTLAQYYNVNREGTEH